MTRQNLERLLPRWAANVLRACKAGCRRLGYRLTPSDKLTPMQQFYRDGYASLLTAGAGLDQSSTVVDIGGYIGQFTDSIVTRFRCRVDVFEPMPEYAAVLRQRFARQPRVTVHEMGLAQHDCERVFYVQADGTGEFSSGEPVRVMFRNIDEVFAVLPMKIDLCAINIEGGEYELLPLMVTQGLIKRVGRLVVQFHRVDEAAVAKRVAIQQLLQATHDCRWNYEFVWECWELRAS